MSYPATLEAAQSVLRVRPRRRRRAVVIDIGQASESHARHCRDVKRVADLISPLFPDSSLPSSAHSSQFTLFLGNLKVKTTARPKSSRIPEIPL